MSSTYLYNPSTAQVFTFSGVTSLRHNLSLKLSTDTDSSSMSDTLTGAKNEPAKLTLSVAESDTDADPSALFTALIALKESRALLQLITPLRTWSNLLLTDLTITRDEKTPFGWTGTLTLQETASIFPPRALHRIHHGFRFHCQQYQYGFQSWHCVPTANHHHPWSPS